MSQYPEPVQRLHDAIQGLPGVSDVGFGIRRLDGITERELSFPGEFGDLPHLAIRRTKGALENELLVTAEIRFHQTFEGWVALEFLSWWVRDLSRSGYSVQIRSLALPPVAYGTQLGRTLKFVIEFFFINPNEDNTQILKQMGDFADSLQSSIQQYKEAITNPTRAEYETVEALIQAAQNDDAEAQFLLAQAYEEGTEVEKEEEKAFHWYERSANWGHPLAMLHLGICYDRGIGIEANPEKAFEAYQKSADQGQTLAMGLMGQCYAEGKGVTQDLVQAVECYRQAAESGEPSCQAELGNCYEEGIGVEKDLQEALNWYRMALEQGFDAVQDAIDRLESQLKE